MVFEARQFIRLVVASCLLLSIAGHGYGQSVAAELSTQEAFVGQALTLTIAVTNTRKYDKPVPPKVDGLEIRQAGPPQRSHQFQLRNGRRTERNTIAWRFAVTPKRAGEFVIPGIKLLVDGGPQTTSPLRLTANTSETGDLLFVEIDDGQDDQAQSKSVYVGQAVKLTLKIWLRPYSDRERNLKLSAQQMWEQIANSSKWGMFQETLDLASQGRAELSVKETLRRDSLSTLRSYYLYEVDAKIYPKRPGEVDIGDVEIKVEYPTSIRVRQRRSISPFGSSPIDKLFSDPFFTGRRAEIQSRPIIASASAPALRVREVPQQGRPATYRGAVGKFGIAAQATPTNATAGDPIKLQLVLQGDSPMELVQPPPLSLVEPLTKDFKIRDDALAGFVQGNGKLFTTTIRPLREGIKAIPPIPFSFFNPTTEQFETTYSDPIPITVAVAEKLSLDDIVGTQSATANETADSVTVDAEKTTAPFEAENYSSNLSLRGSQSVSAMPWTILVFPPSIVGLLWLWRDGKSLKLRLFGDPSPNKLALKKIRAATTHSQLAEILSHAQNNFAAGVEAPALANALQRCEQAAYSPTNQESLETLRQEALHAVELLPAPQTASDRNSVFGQAMKAGIAIAATLFVFTNDGRAEIWGQLNREQQETLLDEAGLLYASGLGDNQSPVVKKEQLEEAASKYQLVAEAGAGSAEVFFNLGNTLLQLGQIGPAVANFEQAHRLAPSNLRIAKNLRFARSKLDTQTTIEPSLLALASELNFAIHTYTKWVAAIFWIAFWICVAVRLLRTNAGWIRIVQIGLLTLFLIAAGSWLFARQHASTFNAVVLRDSGLRSGDGEVYSAINSLTAGQRVNCVDDRSGWLRVHAADSSTHAIGWVKASDVLRLRQM